MKSPGDNASMAPLHAGILIGGASSRMGRPKAMIDLHGQTFLQRAVDALKPHVATIVLLGDGPIPASVSGLRRLADIADTKGPLAGMLAAMRAAPDAAWLFVACDTPLFSPHAAAWLIAQRRAGAVALLPRRGDGPPEPLPGIYEPSARDRLEQLVCEGKPSPRLMADDANVRCPVLPDALLRCWSNVNTPEDLTALIAERADGAPNAE